MQTSLGTETAQKAFRYQVIKTYNRLSSEMETENSIARFKKRCNDFDFDF